MAKKLIFLLAGLGFLIIAYNLVGQIFSAFKSGDRLTQAAEKLYKLEIKNKELKKQLAQVKTPQFIESQARDKLGLARDGETIVVIPKSEIEKVLGAAKKIEEIRFPNWQGWLRLFFK